MLANLKIDSSQKPTKITDNPLSINKDGTQVDRKKEKYKKGK